MLAFVTENWAITHNDELFNDQMCYIISVSSEAVKFRVCRSSTQQWSVSVPALCMVYDNREICRSPGER